MNNVAEVAIERVEMKLTISRRLRDWLDDRARRQYRRERRRGDMIEEMLEKLMKEEQANGGE